jgi:hypothetical protein
MKCTLSIKILIYIENATYTNFRKCITILYCVNKDVLYFNHNSKESNNMLIKNLHFNMERIHIYTCVCVCIYIERELESNNRISSVCNQMVKVFSFVSSKNFVGRTVCRWYEVVAKSSCFSRIYPCGWQITGRASKGNVA